MQTSHRRNDSEHPLDERVAALLAAAAAPTESGPAPGEEQVLAAFRASQETSRRSFVRSPLTPAKTALAAAVGATVLLTGGVAAAATGSLPGAAQETASEMLTKVGITVPGPDDSSAGHPDQRGGAAAEDDEETSDETEVAPDPSEETETEPVEDGSGEESDAAEGKGEVVSEMARSEETTGVEKGAAVSGYASDGKSRAGDNHRKGKPADETEAPAEESGDDAAADRTDGREKAAEQRTEGREKAAEERTDGREKAAEKRQRPESDD